MKKIIDLLVTVIGTLAFIFMIAAGCQNTAKSSLIHLPEIEFNN